MAQPAPTDVTTPWTIMPRLGAEAVAFLIAFALIGLWGLSIAAFGLLGLYLPALAMVPVVYLLMILITRG